MSEITPEIERILHKKYYTSELLLPEEWNILDEWVESGDPCENCGCVYCECGERDDL